MSCPIQKVERPKNLTIYLLLTESNSKHGQVCNAVDLSLPSSCGKNERCQLSRDETSGICTCNRGFIYRNQECFQAPSTENPTASTYTGKPAVKPTSGGNILFLNITTFIFYDIETIRPFCRRRICLKYRYSVSAWWTAALLN